MCDVTYELHNSTDKRISIYTCAIVSCTVLVCGLCTVYIDIMRLFKCWMVSRADFYSTMYIRMFLDFDFKLWIVIFEH